MNERRILRLLAALLAAALLWMVFAGSARAAKPTQHALVIGNSRYAGDRALTNPGNDARLMAKTLRERDFTVTELHDLGRERLAAAVSEFSARLPAGATAFIYYAGHGMQLGGANYLNPVDMPLTSESSARLHSYSLARLLEQLASAKSTVNIVVLDACRNNPFQPGSAAKYRGLRDLGLSKVDAPRGTFIAYSTSPGQLAPDGSGRNSVYTAVLARTLAKPGLELEAVFRTVGSEVRRQTRDDQIPWYESSLAGAYVLGAQEQAAPQPGIPTVAAGGTGARPALSRGMHSSGSSTHWYRQMSAAEWGQLDWEIQQRVRRLTPDEIPALQHKAAGGSVVAQTVLGLAYREGIEPLRSANPQKVSRFKANNSLAWRWLKQAAQAGFPVAQAEIGEMYYQGHGVERNLGQSEHWLALAAEAAYPRAKLDLLQVRAARDPGGVASPAGAEALLEIIKGAVPPEAQRR